MNEPLFIMRNIRKYFPIHGGVFFRKIADVHAVENFTLNLYKGGTLALVGESGCGKSTIAKLLLRLHEPDAGEAIFEGQDVFKLKGQSLLKMRRNMQMIFQDPNSCLNPRMTVGDIIREPLDIHKVGSKKERQDRVRELVGVVGMHENVLIRYPHEFSGGQRQRIGVARALAFHPKLIIADEPVSALDVSIQSQVLNLLVELQQKFDVTYIFISHDLNVVEYISDSVAVMYLGHIVEKARKNEIFKNPLHPYTMSLLSANPIPDPKVKRERVILKGDVPSPINPPPGCPFHPRCFKATEICSKVMPEVKNHASDTALNEHLAACHHPGR